MTSNLYSKPEAHQLYNAERAFLLFVSVVGKSKKQETKKPNQE